MGPDYRLEQLVAWLQHANFSVIKITPIQNDASFRRYFRVFTDKTSFIAMDAPPPKEDCRPFVAIARELLNKGINVPQIYAEDLTQGFLLLSDFGDNVLLALLTEANDAYLYKIALLALLKMQKTEDTPNLHLPIFNKDFIADQQHLFVEWFLTKYLNLQLDEKQKVVLQNVFSVATKNIEEQPFVLVHRDFHSRNLMLLANGEIGILDFQDAMLGPITYDLVSILKDCYIAWPKEKILHEVKYFYSQLQAHSSINDNVTEEQFIRWFDLTGLHRHLRILGTFSRLYLRDGKMRYLSDMPRILRYVQEVSQKYSELADFNEFLQEIILPAMQKLAA